MGNTKMPNENKFNPQISVQNPNSGNFAQTLPSPIQFDHTVANAPYVPGQNKQEYLRGRQTKPFQVQEEAATYALTNPIRQTKPFQDDQMEFENPRYLLLNALKNTKMPNENKFNPQISAQNPNSGNFAQTLPSPIQFDSTV